MSSTNNAGAAPPPPPTTNNPLQPPPEAGEQQPDAVGVAAPPPHEENKVAAAVAPPPPPQQHQPPPPGAETALVKADTHDAAAAIGAVAAPPPPMAPADPAGAPPPPLPAVAPPPPPAPTTTPGGIVLLDRSNSLHQKILAESYVFNVGVGNSRRRDLFPGNRSFWDWIYAEGFFQRWVKASTGNSSNESGRDILDQVYASWKAAGGEFYRYENSKKNKEAADMAWRGETLSPMPKDAVLGELHKRFTTTRSNMKQPRKKQAKSIWYSRLDPQEQQQMILDKQREAAGLLGNNGGGGANTPQSFPYVKTNIQTASTTAAAFTATTPLPHPAHQTTAAPFRPPTVPLPGLNPSDMSVAVTGVAGVGQALGIGSGRYQYTTTTTATAMDTSTTETTTTENTARVQELEQVVREKDGRIAELEQALARYTSGEIKVAEQQPAEV